MTNPKSISEEIEKLERELLNSQTRKSAEFLSEILADEFIEFGGSGIIYNKKQIIDALRDETTPIMTLRGFNFQQLGDEHFHVTFKVLKKGIEKNIDSLRSSIWKIRNNKLQMIFHQGTIIADNEE